MPRSKFNSNLKKGKPARKSKLRNKCGGSNMRVNRSPSPEPGLNQARSSRRSTVSKKPSSPVRSDRPIRSGRSGRPIRSGRSGRSGRSTSSHKPEAVKGPRTPTDPEAVKEPPKSTKSTKPAKSASTRSKKEEVPASPAESDRCNKLLLSVINAVQAITTLANCLDPEDQDNFFKAMSGNSYLSGPSITVHNSLKNIKDVALREFIAKDIYEYKEQFAKVIEELGKID